MKFKSIIKGIGKVIGRTVDNIVTGGAIYNAIEETTIKTNSKKVLNESLRGKVDLPKWFAMVIITLPLWYILLVKAGVITFEQAKWLLENSPK